MSSATQYRNSRSALRFTTDLPAAGNHFFVHAGTGGTSSGHGYTPEAPLTTLAAAIALCTADKGDVIHILPGHAETITAAAGVAMSIAGVTVIGYGNGRNRPVFTLTNTDNAPSFDITAASCRVENCVFINDDDALTAMMNITAADVTVRDCEFVLATSAKQAVIGILASDAADRLTLERLHMHGSADAGCDHAISAGGCDDTLIKDCLIMGAFAVGGAIENAAAAVNFNVIGCTIMNQTADGDNKCVVYHASTTGIISNNRFACIDSTSPNPFTCAAGYVSGNYFTGAVSTTASTLK
jgi:hypothetical protein